MQDLSKWSYADEFTPFEAACLIVGFDPTENPQDLRVEHLMRRMAKAYSITLDHVGSEVWPEIEDEDLAAWCPDYAPDAGDAPLRSVKLEASLYAWEQGSEEIKEWLNDEKACNFQEQCFSARTLDSWLASTGVKSAFAFTRDDHRGAENSHVVSATAAAGDNGAEIAFGRHRTRLLRKLADAYHKHWALYEPDDPTTAPTSETVINWLVAEGVSRRIAEGMATILRPEGLPAGRR